MSDPTDQTATATETAIGPATQHGERTWDSDGAPASADPATPDAGDVISRYIVVGRLGSGAMGVVVAAHDPKLDRKVALKLLRPRGRGQEAARVRLQREAQALAKLAHPNVVAVHDVGMHQERVFLAMEHVEGETLREWKQRAPRSTAQIIDVFLQAGRGLAAAHEAGLVHRDFKPDNVMIDARGRVRVMDFGLARTDERPEEEPAASGGSFPLDVVDLDRLTRTGALMGTPAYMAPEQFAGAAADARSDQFAFCVALYEALYGERPFSGESLAEIALATQEGKLALPVTGPAAAVPARLRRTIARGLETRPEDRWPTMVALLDELTAQTHRRRRGWTTALFATAFALALGLFAVQRTQPEPCADATRHLVGVWDEERRNALEAGLTHGAEAYAADVWGRVEARLDAYTSAWVEQREEACMATHVHAEQSEGLLDKRMHCLDRRLDEAGLLIGVLSRGEDGVLERAIQAVDALEPVEACADVEALIAQTERPTDPTRLAQVEQAEHDLAEATALARAGQWKRAREITRDVVERAEEIGFVPLLLKALANRGKFEEWSGEIESAVETQRRVFFTAVEHQQPDPAANAATELAFLVGNNLARFDEGLAWVAHAEPHARASHNPERIAHAISARGNIAFRQGRYADADHDLAHALEIYAENFDPAHRTVLASRANLGNLAYVQGRYEEARSHYAAVLEAKIEQLGPDHPGLAADESNLGNVETDLGNYAQAERLYESALARRRASIGDENEQVATVLSNLGRLAALRHDDAQARARHEECLRIREAVLPEGHWSIGATTSDLAAVEAAAGNHERARELYARALEIEEASLGPEHMYVAYPILGLGEAEAALGNPVAAKAWMERALEIRTTAGEAPSVVADSAFTLAKLLWASPPPVRDRARAHALAVQARDGYAEGGPGAPERKVEVETWLGEHDPPRTE